ncbi:hypothetical protein [Pareuzebyella sediminis]|uniref:hypothetical protein n=1 Tax=Pareuzebyella sediminis TaxID=2607998 RepID=UPI0011EC61C6|nr:hypothetical protein [Pareuzebyella sediminis]
MKTITKRGKLKFEQTKLHHEHDYGKITHRPTFIAVLLAITFTLQSCNQKVKESTKEIEEEVVFQLEKSELEEQVMAYYNGFKNSDYRQIRKQVSDSLTITEGDYTMTFNPELFQEHFKWDSIFQPVYEVVELENKDEQVVATVAVKSLRFEFLKNNPLTCRHQFHFKAGKIAKIENLECPDANWELWQIERDALVNWVKINHPELDGFINDLSRQGALDYVKAIDLYQKRQVN